MDERLKETLSAMLDDQADELSVRRVLSHPEQEQVRAQWQRWQSVRDLMNDSHAHDSIDISARVRQRLSGTMPDAAASQAVTPVSSDRRWHWPAVAMVFAALVVGFGAGSGWDSAPVELSGTVASVSESSSPEAEAVQEVALQGLDEEQMEHLSRYLLEHAQHNSVAAGRGSVGYARLASVSAAY